MASSELEKALIEVLNPTTKSPPDKDLKMIAKNTFT